jgi:hypothetical protein
LIESVDLPEDKAMQFDTLNVRYEKHINMYLSILYMVMV